ncbi:MAG: hypothetical protein QOC92_2746 [Acidimicrobiaceae bacterium]|jgi:hypothetical protein
MHSARRIIWSTLAVLALAPAAAMASGSGSTAERHQMSMYKVEEDVSFDAVEVKTLSVACNGSDYALDGMWRVTQTDYEPQLEDQATPPGGWNDYNGIQIWDSHSVGPGTWRFTIYNDTSEAAQVKVWVTCINKRVQPADRDAHTHKLVLGNTHFDTVSFSGTTPGTAKAGNWDCPHGSIAVAPGFEVLKGDMRVFKSVPGNNNLTNWKWGFYQQGFAKIETSIRCLDLASTSDANPLHYHELVVNQRETNIGIQAGVKDEVKIDCSPYEKAMIGLFDVRAVGSWTSPFDQHWLWYLGMEPQIKSRVFRIWNVDSAVWNARIGAICFNDRIGRRVLAP